MLINKKKLIYLILTISLFVGFYFEENSSGGAKIDFNFLLPFIENFKLNFLEGFNQYLNNSGTILHSPVFYVMCQLFKIFDNIFT